MKALNKILQILSLAFGLCALVLFFLPFSEITSGSNTVVASGAQLAFGTSVTVGDAIANMAKSADLLLVFITTVLSVIFGGLSFKAKGNRIASFVFALFSGIFMLVISLSNPWKFVDSRPLESVTAINYSALVLYTAIALLACAIIGIIGWLLNDYIEVKASNGNKKTILKRFVQFLKDYKSEVKKIVWPGPKAVVKNSLIVLVMCAIIGAFIWILDYALIFIFDLIAKIG